jgi:hypothetical protein
VGLLYREEVFQWIDPAFWADILKDNLNGYNKFLKYQFCLFCWY